MAYPTDEHIRTRAHELWEKAGKPEGKQDEFWHLAEQELLNEDKSSPLRTPDASRVQRVSEHAPCLYAILVKSSLTI